MVRFSFNANSTYRHEYVAPEDSVRVIHKRLEAREKEVILGRHTNNKPMWESMTPDTGLSTYLEDFAPREDVLRLKRELLAGNKHATLRSKSSSVMVCKNVERVFARTQQNKEERKRRSEARRLSQQQAVVAPPVSNNVDDRASMISGVGAALNALPSVSGTQTVIRTLDGAETTQSQRDDVASAAASRRSSSVMQRGMRREELLRRAATVLGHAQTYLERSALTSDDLERRIRDHIDETTNLHEQGDDEDNIEREESVQDDGEGAVIADEDGAGAGGEAERLVLPDLKARSSPQPHPQPERTPTPICGIDESPYPCMATLAKQRLQETRIRNEQTSIGIGKLREMMSQNTWYLRNNVDPSSVADQQRRFGRGTTVRRDDDAVGPAEAAQPMDTDINRQVLAERDEQRRINAEYARLSRLQHNDPITHLPSPLRERKVHSLHELRMMAQRHACLPEGDFRPELPGGLKVALTLKDVQPTAEAVADPTETRHLAAVPTTTRAERRRLEVDDRRRVDRELKGVRDLGVLRRSGGSRFITKDGRLVPPPTMLALSAAATSLHAGVGVEPMTPKNIS
eukprot:PhM_4_TR8155/c0_g1_i1/m.1667